MHTSLFSSSATHSPGVIPSQRTTRHGAAPGSRLKTVTVCPWPWKWRARIWPTCPLPPGITMRIDCSVTHVASPVSRSYEFHCAATSGRDGYNGGCKMHAVIPFLIRHGYWVLVANVFAEGIGLPVPSFPVLLGMGALAGLGNFSIWIS